MPWFTRSIHPALRAVLHSWTGYNVRTHPELIHHGLPSTGLTVVLSMGDPVDCGWLGAPGGGHYEVLVAGLTPPRH